VPSAASPCLPCGVAAAAVATVATARTAAGRPPTAGARKPRKMLVGDWLFLGLCLFVVIICSAFFAGFVAGFFLGYLWR
jgi:hypothetical protein